MPLRIFRSIEPEACVGAGTVCVCCDFSESQILLEPVNKGDKNSQQNLTKAALRSCQPLRRYTAATASPYQAKQLKGLK
jgi:hypothetical protein